MNFIMKRSYYIFGIIIIIIITILFVGMFIVYNNKSTSISLEKAENIALAQAEIDGYKKASIWTRFNSKTKKRYAFSTKENRDIKVWQVNIDADHNPPV